jgi:hypothetical protein
MSSTGAKFHWMPAARVSYAVIWLARRTSARFHVAAIARFCGKTVAVVM